MARVETYRSRGTPSPVSGSQPVPWPHLMGASGRGQQQLGATIEGVSRGLLDEHIKDKAAEELNNLEVDLIKGWGTYQNWTQTNLDNPDIDGAVFKEHATTWRQEYLSKMSPGLPKQIGERRLRLFEAQKAEQASALALRQQRINAQASFVSDVDALTTLPDQVVTKEDIEDRLNAIALMHDRAADIGAIEPGESVKAQSIREAGRELWINGIVTAMKNSPQDVEALLSDPDNFLTAEDEMDLRGQWQAMQDRAKADQEKIDKALIKDRFNVVSQAIDNGTADGTLIYRTYQEDNNRSDEFNEAIREARKTQFNRLDGASKPDPKTDWGRQQEGQQAVLDYWTGAIEGGKEGAIDRLQKLRYEDRVLSSDDYALLRGQLDKEYPYDTVKAIESAFGTAERGINARYGWLAGEKEEVKAQIQRAVLSRVEMAESKGQSVSPMELSDLAAQLAAGAGPRPAPPGEASRIMRRTEPPKSEDIDLTGIPVLKSLKQTEKDIKKPFDAETSEPESVEEFLDAVARMKGQDVEAARRYYERWKDKWQNP